MDPTKLRRNPSPPPDAPTAGPDDFVIEIDDLASSGVDRLEAPRTAPWTPTCAPLVVRTSVPFPLSRQDLKTMLLVTSPLLCLIPTRVLDAPNLLPTELDGSAVPGLAAASFASLLWSGPMVAGRAWTVGRWCREQLRPRTRDPIEMRATYLNDPGQSLAQKPFPEGTRGAFATPGTFISAGVRQRDGHLQTADLQRALALHHDRGPSGLASYLAGGHSVLNIPSQELDAALLALEAGPRQRFARVLYAAIRVEAFLQPLTPSQRETWRKIETNLDEYPEAENSADLHHLPAALWQWPPPEGATAESLRPDLRTLLAEHAYEKLYGLAASVGDWPDAAAQALYGALDGHNLAAEEAEFFVRLRAVILVHRPDAIIRAMERSEGPIDLRPAQHLPPLLRDQTSSGIAASLCAQPGRLMSAAQALGNSGMSKRLQAECAFRIFKGRGPRTDPEAYRRLRRLFFGNLSLKIEDCTVHRPGAEADITELTGVQTAEEPGDTEQGPPCSICFAADEPRIEGECGSCFCADCFANNLVADRPQAESLRFPCPCRNHSLAGSHLEFLMSEFDHIGPETKHTLGRQTVDDSAVEGLDFTDPALIRAFFFAQQDRGNTWNEVQDCQRSDDCPGFTVHLPEPCTACAQFPLPSRPEAIMRAQAAAAPSINYGDRGAVGALQNTPARFSSRYGHSRPCPQCDRPAQRALNPAGTAPAREGDGAGCGHLACGCGCHYNDGHGLGHKDGRDLPLSRFNMTYRDYVTAIEAERGPCPDEFDAVRALLFLGGLTFGPRYLEWVQEAPGRGGRLTPTGLEQMRQSGWTQTRPAPSARAAWYQLRESLRDHFPEDPAAACLLWIAEPGNLRGLARRLQRRDVAASNEVAFALEHPRDSFARSRPDAAATEAWATAFAATQRKMADLELGGDGLNATNLQSEETRDLLVDWTNRLRPALAERFLVRALGTTEHAPLDVDDAADWLQSWVRDWAPDMAEAACALDANLDVDALTEALTHFVVADVIKIARSRVRSSAARYQRVLTDRPTEAATAV